MLFLISIAQNYYFLCNHAKKIMIFFTLSL